MRKCPFRYKSNTSILQHATKEKIVRKPFKTQMEKQHLQDSPESYQGWNRLKSRFLLYLSNSEGHLANEKKILAITTKCLSPKGSQTYCICSPTLFSISKTESTHPALKNEVTKSLFCVSQATDTSKCLTAFHLCPKNAAAMPECWSTGNLWLATC